MANFANFKKYRDQQFILRKSAGSQLFAAFLVEFANLRNWPRNWQILKIHKKMANFLKLKKYRDLQFILRKSAGNQLFAAFLVTYEIGREISEF